MNPLLSNARRALHLVVASAPAGYVLRALAPERTAILTYHRFAVGADPVRGMTSATALRATLTYLRKHRYRLVHFRDATRASREAPGSLAGSVVVTVDDGYADFAEIAQPIFAEFDCPVTVFVSTGPVDRTCWYWWDRVRLAVERTRARRVDVDVAGVSLTGSWTDDVYTRHREAEAFCETLKRVPTTASDAAVDALVSTLDVDLPDLPPRDYAAMTWDEIRRCERAGVTIGGHTVSHPVLSRCDDARAAWEITEGLSRLRTECAGPIDVFAYPNGQPLDFGARETTILRASGIEWACTTSAGYVTASPARDDNVYRVPRFSDPGPLFNVARIASGRASLRSRGRDSTIPREGSA